MNSKETFDVLASKEVPSQSYEVFLADDYCYFGKDNENNIVFMIPSMSERVTPIHQETRSLRFSFNKRCTFKSGNLIENRVVHLLTCKEKDEEKILAFIRLTKAFAQNERNNDQYFLAKLFSSISALFDKTRNVSEIELQGLFAELYTIIHLGENGCDVSRYWQSRNMMKFDFSINKKKRLEIKSTLKSSRTHHFKHDQLLDELYDIKIVSIMLRKNDFGLSISDLVEKIREDYSDNFALLMHIDSIISYVDNDLLRELKYDEIYLKDNLKYFNVKDIPRFNEKSPDGVFNAEYDCCLDTSKPLLEKELIEWIKEG